MRYDLADGLTIRPSVIEDYEEIIRICAIPEIRKSQLSLDDKAKVLLYDKISLGNIDNSLNFTLLLKNDVIGHVCLEGANNDGRDKGVVYFIGFNLHPEYWGRGIMAESLRTIISNVFSEETFVCIYADCHYTNRRCRKLLKKIGFFRVSLSTVEWIRWCIYYKRVIWFCRYALRSDMWK